MICHFNYLLKLKTHFIICHYTQILKNKKKSEILVTFGLPPFLLDSFILQYIILKNIPNTIYTFDKNFKILKRYFLYSVIYAILSNISKFNLTTFHFRTQLKQFSLNRSRYYICFYLYRNQYSSEYLLGSSYSPTSDFVAHKHRNIRNHGKQALEPNFTHYI